MIAQLVAAAALAVFVGAVTYAAVRDLTTYTIPNRVSLALIAGFAVFAPVSGLDAGTLGLHLAAGAAVLAVTFTMFALGWIGGGDAKLAACVGLWMGWSSVLEYVLVATLVGGVFTLVLLSARQLPLPAVMVRIGWVSRLHDRASGVPYGVALAAGALIVLPHAPVWSVVFP